MYIRPSMHRHTCAYILKPIKACACARSEYMYTYIYQDTGVLSKLRAYDFIHIDECDMHDCLDSLVWV